MADLRSYRGRGLRSVVPILLIAVVAHAGARAQQTAAPPPPTPPTGQQPFKAGTNFVRVDVFPTHNDLPVEDLTAADFDVSEDGKPQKIETFEYIKIEPAGADARVDPSSPSRANQLAADPHRRVFVIFLDTGGTDIPGSHAIKEPIIELLTKILGADDLVGVMTPDMSPQQITFGRKTQVIEEGLRDNWAWGRKNTMTEDKQEQKYDICFPPMPGEMGRSAKATEMIYRYRERVVLDSFRELVLHMASIREGRTAVLAVSAGWQLFPPSSTLSTIRKDPNTGQPIDALPGAPPPVGVGPGGTLTTKEAKNNPYAALYQECQRDLMDLANQDDAKYFRDILGDANRANVSFYPIDPRGLAAFDTDIGPEPPLPIALDRAVLRNRTESLRVLAANTDGIALVENNDLRAQMHRLAAHLTSYYLLGYSSTNTALDGGFRKIKVRVKRPGVAVRARSGYRAATAGELATAQKKPSAVDATRPAALTAELGALERDARIQGSPASATPPSRSTDVAGEPIFFRRGPSTANQLQRAANRQFSRTERLHIEMLPGSAEGWTGALLDRNGKTLPVAVTTGERTDAASGQRWLTADVTLAPLGAGEYGLELTTRHGGQEQKILRAIRVTQ